jgi:hypothetical protein
MNEIATENESMKKTRINLSLPARVIVVGGIKYNNNNYFNTITSDIKKFDF